jgi:hypothetical protein
MTLIHLSTGGPDRWITDSQQVEWKFEDHPRFGPIRLNKRGDMHKVQPGARSAFWPAWTAWDRGGRRVDANGRCIYDPPAQEDLVHLGGRNYALARSRLAQKLSKE